MITPLYIVGVVLSVWYMFKFGGYELVFVAVLLDGYFGAFYHLPLITICSLALVLFIDLLKPRLLMYTSDNEMVS
ncbi:MAG: hypothetical protein H6779_00810 [Candidatus Nomurabacteria bacterium]|nr:hypothetical protein [Candidatus Nomurabacteria bacterium]USN87970.1 MAG: hypothetical protein H6779_00810 [Candidatus Nomurabacteria bacterium]